MTFPYLGALKIALILTLLGLIGVQTWRVDRLQKELAQIEATANAAEQETSKNLEVLRESIPIMVDEAQSVAVRNYLARRSNPSRDTSHCPRTDGVPNSSGEAASPEGTHAASPDAVACRPDEEFIKQCAATTALYNAWRKLCELNPLTCEVKQ